ncbi:MAG: LytTR family DNA-binding domain-containing protein [Anaerostipes sp.]|nr:LytTR family DNA-binding domain-containing protein [Anaerostipes sp.]
MYKIAICDDDLMVCKQLEDMLHMFEKKTGMKFDIRVFDCGEKLQKDFHESDHVDILFLDICMEGINGIDVGRFIRNTIKKEEIKIVYISTEASYAMNLFEVRPFQFLIKPLEEEKVFSILQEAITIMERNQKRIFRFRQREHIQIPECDILYFEKYYKVIKIVLAHGQSEQIHSTLKSVFEQVSKDTFFYSHQSFLVNYNQVQRFMYDHLIMKNGDKVPISQPKRKEIREMQMKMEFHGGKDGSI